ncbi:type II toxin-antitoxin system PemK/MazF family toxin [Peribacillus sp. NPDC096448]|uniref:type II toxin-antitoxin system PemK/MazF family toxin n=1 Tax=Peribacillus sp. NPDC096448 TaxID=3364395 RepID=UPI0037F11223
MKEIKRGEIYNIDLSPVAGSEQSGLRPALIIQNDIGNENSPTVIIAVLTKQIKRNNFPTHIYLDKDKFKLKENSILMLEHIRTVDKTRIFDKVSSIDEKTMFEVEQKILISLGINATINR